MFLVYVYMYFLVKLRIIKMNYLTMHNLWQIRYLEEKMTFS